MTALAKKPVSLFHDLRHAELFSALKDMHRKQQLIDWALIVQRLKDEKKLKLVGGMEYLSDLPDKAPSKENVPYYLSILEEKHALRKLAEVCAESIKRIQASEGNVHELMRGVQADLDLVTRLGLADKERKALTICTAKDLEEYVPPEHFQLIGDNEICMGYEGVTVLAGPGSSGKSLAVTSLVLAAARGYGFWMGRKVHRRFRILVIQAENGKRRLKKEVAALKTNHPELDLDDCIYYSAPPEGGLCFHRPDFRAAVREEVAKIKPDLVVLDPWSQVAADDAAKEVVDKLAEIRSCFPAEEQCPGLLIVAHTKKPRSEDVRKGRALMFNVSGSVALINTARCVYMLLPWTDDLDDPRIYWSCPKLNDGENYPPTVWKRKFGTFFEHDDKTNPKDFGRADDDREKITEDHLHSAFEKTAELKSGDLVKKLAKISGAGDSTCWRAIGEDGYLRPLLMRSGFGKLKLKEMQE